MLDMMEYILMPPSYDDDFDEENDFITDRDLGDEDDWHSIYDDVELDDIFWNDDDDDEDDE